MATKKYLDQTGLQQVWGKIKTNFAPNRLASGSTSGLVYTDSSVQTGLTTTNGYYPTPIKDGIVYYQDTHTTKAGHYDPGVVGLYYTTGEGDYEFSAGTNSQTGHTFVKKVSLVVDTKGHTLFLSGATGSIEDVSYAPSGNPSLNQYSGVTGLMTWQDKQKLDGISPGASSGTTLNGHYTPTIERPEAYTTSGEYYVYSAGNNQFITDLKLYVDAKGHTVDFSGSTGGVATYGIDGHDNTQYSGTTGLMSWEDKLKLDNVSPGASSGTTKAGHYTPSADSSDTNISASTTTSPSKILTGTTLITGVSIRKDDKGHIVSYALSSSTIPKGSINDFGLVKTLHSANSANGLISLPIVNGVIYHYTPTATTGVLKSISAATTGDVICDLTLSSDTQGHVTSMSYKTLSGVESGAQVNKIESITVGTTTFGPPGLTNKAIDLTSAINGLINTKVSSAVVPKGTKTFAQLTGITMSSDTLGDMYNISDSFTINNTFKEYDSSNPKTYPAGTNVVCVEDGTNTYKWDVMAGFVDLSGYQLSSDIGALSEAEINAACT